jgi:hypothetical protein
VLSTGRLAWVFAASWTIAAAAAIWLATDAARGKQEIASVAVWAILPFMLWVWRLARLRLSRVLAAVVLIVLAVRIAAGATGILAAARENLNGDPSRLSNYPTIQASEWLRANASKNDMVAAQKPAIVHLLTDLPVTGLPVTSNPKILTEHVARQRVRFLVIADDSNDPAPYYLPRQVERLAILRKNGVSLQEVAAGPGFRVFSIPR